MRRWELIAGGSAKFWQIGRDGASVTVRYGRLGTAGQTKVKDFGSEESAVAHVDKLVAEKEKKGYRSDGAEVAAPPRVAEISATAASEPDTQAVRADGAVPDAPADVLSPALVTPPWKVERAAPKPIAVDVVVPRGFEWEPGEREQWAKASCYGPSSGIGVDYGDQDWRVAVDRLCKGELRGRDVLAVVAGAPEDVLRPRLAEWEPVRDDYMGWERVLVARFEGEVLPQAVRIAKSDATYLADLLLPFADAEVAALMADWLVRVKRLRDVAELWFRRHPETAARALLPAALGRQGKVRRAAEVALWLVAEHGHADLVRRVAAEHGEQVADAVDALLQADPAGHHLQARVPVVGSWADPALLPRILVRDTRYALPAAVTAHVLTMMALSRPDDVLSLLTMSKPDDVHRYVEVVRAECDRESLARFGWAVFEAWRGEGMPSKDRWALSAQGMVGDDETVRALAPVVRAWPGEGAHPRALIGLRALAAIGSTAALLQLNGIATKSQFGALRSRAAEMIDTIAEDRGLTAEQLADRLVPDFGLDDAASLVVDYGPRRFTVGFDKRLTPYVADGDGVRLKALPKPGVGDDQDLAAREYRRFVQLRKDVRTVAADQVRRFEAAMVAGRRWPVAEFRELFVAHPLLWHVVRRLVWVTGDGVSFRLAEDRTVADVHDDVVDLPQDAVVGVAHPVHLADCLDGWVGVFADYEVLQPFAQLSRPVHVLSEDERAASRLKRFENVAVPTAKVLELARGGWELSAPEEGGIRYSVGLSVPGGTVAVELDPGVPAGQPSMTEPQRLAEVVLRGRRTFGELDAVSVSEVLADLTRLTT
ncbi:DUF4132 domain-containing protein [Umezawaea tangerina]|uniref:Putative DNA-binding WGR domain protein n=1 Tax=Umezawaea tangerina TaxID=84725 RepID=A0A2T0T7S4_9PSEU|nr:DUF4132 domain-containing protein [Umezawaea tangerina]PRY41720.1 putative DNA-binding WGR domain protein [Umezawaea tangerina]